jgi:hypothetical protein
MLRYIATYICAWTVFTSVTAFSCGSVIAIAGVLSPRLNEPELDSMQTPDVAELERLFETCVPADSEQICLIYRRRAEMTGHERRCAVAVAIFALGLFVLSLLGMLFAAAHA